MSGYLTKKRVSDRVYIYLRKSLRVNGKVNHEYIYSFGSLPGALKKMYEIMESPNNFPAKLSDAGYELGDLLEWIMTLETRVTSNGRCFDWDK